MKWSLVMAFFLIALASACEERDGEKVLNPPTDNLTFEGITPTDLLGNVIGEPDPDDWKNESTWPYEHIVQPLWQDTLLCDPSPYGARPTDFSVHAAYPNPCSLDVTISYCYPREANVIIAIIDETNNVVRILVNGRLPWGYYKASWDLKNEGGAEVQSDVYRCIFRAWYFEDEEEIIAYQSHGDISVQ